MPDRSWSSRRMSAGCGSWRSRSGSVAPPDLTPLGPRGVESRRAASPRLGDRPRPRPGRPDELEVVRGLLGHSALPAVVILPERLAEQSEAVRRRWSDRAGAPVPALGALRGPADHRGQRCGRSGDNIDATRAGSRAAGRTRAGSRAAGRTRAAGRRRAADTSRDRRRRDVASMTGRTLTLGGSSYPLILPSIRDPRLHVAAVIITIHVLGQVGLHFQVSVPQILAAILTCAIIEVALTFRQTRSFVWPASAMLTGSGVALILRVVGTPPDDPWNTYAGGRVRGRRRALAPDEVRHQATAARTSSTRRTSGWSWRSSSSAARASSRSTSGGRRSTSG